MGLGQAMLAAWMALQPGAAAPLPMGLAPWEAGMIVVAKPVHEMATSEGGRDGAVAKRPWSGAGGAQWCEISMVEGFGDGLGWRAADMAVQMFALAHEVGHCVDGSSYSEGEAAMIEREAFADAFAACVLSIEGFGQDARGMAAGREESIKGRRGKEQALAIRKALSNRACAPGEGKDGFVRSWRAAGQAQAEMFGGRLAEPAGGRK